MWWDEGQRYTNYMIKEAVRQPIGKTPIAGWIWSSNVSNFEIILWALQKNWSEDGVGVEGYATKLCTSLDLPGESITHEYIKALSDPRYINTKISQNIMNKIKDVTNIYGFATTTYPTSEIEDEYDAAIDTFITFVTTPENLMMIGCVALTCYAVQAGHMYSQSDQINEG